MTYARVQIKIFAIHQHGGSRIIVKASDHSLQAFALGIDYMVINSARTLKAWKFPSCPLEPKERHCG